MALPGRLLSVTELPIPDVPPALKAFKDPGDPRPRRDMGVRADCRV